MNSEFRNVELRRLDLTLLLVFLGLLKHRKAADVAVELGLSRSGVSQALGRLRDIFGDTLFLRRAHGLEPTALALRLETPVADAVDTLRNALGTATEFVPTQAEGTLHIAAMDTEQVVLIPALVEHLYLHAPNLRIKVVSYRYEETTEMLHDGAVDIVLTDTPFEGDKINQTALYSDGWRVVCQPKLLTTSGALTPQAYAVEPHLEIVSNQIEKMMNPATNNAPCVALTLPSYLCALAFISRTGGIATVPMRLADMFAGDFGLTRHEMPDMPRAITVSALWHIRNNRDARLMWVLDQIKHVAQPR